MKKSKKTGCENCWEHMKCSYHVGNNCVVYMTKGKPCWILNQKGKKKDDAHILHSCRQCNWYKMNNGIV